MGSPSKTAALGLIALAAALIVVVIVFVASGDDDESAPAGDAAAASAQADPEAVSLFSENCGTCHTLTVAGTDGDVGPNLDDEAYDTERVRNAIANGAGNGQMPPGPARGRRGRGRRRADRHRRPDAGSARLAGRRQRRGLSATSVRDPAHRRRVPRTKERACL